MTPNLSSAVLCIIRCIYKKLIDSKLRKNINGVKISQASLMPEYELQFDQHFTTEGQNAFHFITVVKKKLIEMRF